MKNLLLFMIFVVPMGAQAFSFQCGPYKMSLFRMAILFSWALLLFKSRNTKLLLYNVKNKYSVLFMLFWAFYALLSFAWAREMTNFIRSIFFLFTGVSAIILFVNNFKSLKDIEWAFKALACGIFVQSSIGWYEVFTKDYHFIELIGRKKDYLYGLYGVPVAMCYNENDFALLMLAGILVFLICASFAKHRLEAILCCIFSVNCALLLFCTNSRANFAGFFLAAAFLLIISDKKILLSITGIFAALLFYDFWPHILESIESIGSTGSDSIRLALILNGLYFLFYTCGFGVGAGQIESYMQKDAVFFTGGITNMHNWWFECLTAYGVFVFVLYLVFFCKLFIDLFINIKRAHCRFNNVNLMLCAFMVGFVIASTSSSSNISCEWLWVFWAIIIAYQGILPRSFNQTSFYSVKEHFQH